LELAGVKSSFVQVKVANKSSAKLAYPKSLYTGNARSFVVKMRDIAHPACICIT